MPQILIAALALIGWTFVIWLWMYVTRIPAMQKAGIDAGKIQRPQDLDGLPVSVTRISDNYNHLHEQPTLFYALCAITALTAGAADAVQIGLAWGYVGARVAHSLWQALVNFVPVRFFLFNFGTLVLIAMTVKLALPLLG